MPQVQLPLFPAGVTPINEALAVACRDDEVTYFNGHLPVFRHARSDLASFRLFTTQLVINGTATQGQIVRAFGVPLITVKRCTKRYRSAGAAAFFAPAKPRTGSRLTPEKLEEAQALLDRGQEVPEVGRRTGVLANTLHKAIRAGRLRRPVLEKKRPGRS